MTSTRRQFLAGSAALLVVGRGMLAEAAETSPAVAALDRSSLIYLTPVLRNGSESHCHGEVWFVRYEERIFVVTKADAWRTQAVRNGLDRAKIWIGEFGVWTRADGRFRSAPYLEVRGSIASAANVHREVLAVFAEKYADEWGKWGPRFRNGLADGSRAMLRYDILR